MARSKRFALLVTLADGRRVCKTSVPGWAVLVTLGTAVLIIIGTGWLGAFYKDYVRLRLERESMAPLLSRLAEQQTLIELYGTRVREIRAEIDSWQGLHAKIWEPFSPESGAAKVTLPGMGGLSVPNAPPAATGSGDPRAELAALASTVQEEGENLRSLERFFSRANKILASLPSRWPLRGPINSDFGKRLSPWAPSTEFHGGLDIGAPVGTAITAPAPGTVIFAGRHAEYGIAAIIDHGNDIRSLYGHLSRLNISAGQRVDRGEVIAWSGNTGRSSGPHLHYEIQVNGKAVNPHSYIWE